MKKSNSITIVILALIFLSLFYHDTRLRAEYLSGRYKNIYRNFVNLQFKDFDAVDVSSSTVANVKFIQGPFKVMVDSDALRHVKVSQQGKKLVISANFDDKELYNGNPFVLLVSCPILNQVNASAVYMVEKKQVIDSAAEHGWDRKYILIDGFKQDSLNIIQDYGSGIVLAHNTISTVHAIVGKTPGSSGKLTVQPNNQFQDVTLDICNKSLLQLNNARISKLSYHLADSAKMTISGAMQKLMK